MKMYLMTVITEMCYHTNNNPDKQSLCITFSKVPSYSSFLFRYRKNHIIDCRFQKSKNNKNNKKTPKKKKNRISRFLRVPHYLFKLIHIQQIKINQSIASCFIWTNTQSSSSLPSLSGEYSS